MHLYDSWSSLWFWEHRPPNTDAQSLLPRSQKWNLRRRQDRLQWSEQGMARQVSWPAICYKWPTPFFPYTYQWFFLLVLIPARIEERGKEEGWMSSCMVLNSQLCFNHSSTHHNSPFADLLLSPKHLTWSFVPAQSTVALNAVVSPSCGQWPPGSGPCVLRHGICIQLFTCSTNQAVWFIRRPCLNGLSLEIIPEW